ncbi:hypothetical protein CcaCcLH18_12361 [Colletotrichum camelliae]|nr:hypothetical protein CcaCcLH18_12361 [Colletotrichum camelliae]
MIRSRSRGRLAFLLTIPFFFFSVIHYLATPTIVLQIQRRNATLHLTSPETTIFWHSLRSLLNDTDPKIPLLKPLRDLTEAEYDPAKINDISARLNDSSARPDLIPLTRDTIDALAKKHSTFVASIDSLVSTLPVWRGTTGIVISAGGGYLGPALTSLLLLRRSGSTLPVHVFLDSPSEYDENICLNILPRLGAECLLFSSFISPTDDVHHYQYKVLSIIFSPFEKVLSIDSDAWPIASPDDLFTTEPFLSNGLITWPDFWLSTISPHFFKIANFTPPATLRRHASESGILLYNKRTHARSLLLAAYYNWYGPNVYYPLLSQHAPGEGDKETFAQAALALSQPLYDVRSPITVLGRWFNGTFESAGMKQADPISDFYHQLHDLEASHAGEPPTEIKTKTLFIHHNSFKIDIFKVGEPDDPIFRTDDDGKVGRLWDANDLINETGYDLEKEMWEIVCAASCNMKSSNTTRCEALRQWFDVVFTGTK